LSEWDFSASKLALRIFHMQARVDDMIPEDSNSEIGDPVRDEAEPAA